MEQPLVISSSPYLINAVNPTFRRWNGMIGGAALLRLSFWHDNFVAWYQLSLGVEAVAVSIHNPLLHRTRFADTAGPPLLPISPPHALIKNADPCRSSLKALV